MTRIQELEAENAVLYTRVRMLEERIGKVAALQGKVLELEATYREVIALDAKLEALNERTLDGYRYLAKLARMVRDRRLNIETRISASDRSMFDHFNAAVDALDD